MIISAVASTFNTVTLPVLCRLYKSATSHRGYEGGTLAQGTSDTGEAQPWETLPTPENQPAKGSCATSELRLQHRTGLVAMQNVSLLPQGT